MRIALFHNLMSGGAKRTLCETVKRLSGKHQIEAYTLSSASHEFADIRNFVARYEVFNFRPTPLLTFPLARLNQAIRLIDLFRLNQLARMAAQRIDAEGYDVVLVHPCQFENSPSLLRYLRKTPSVYYCHEALRLLYEEMPYRPYDRRNSARQRMLGRLDFLPALYYSTLKRIDRQNARSAKIVLVNSEYIRDVVRSVYQIEAQVSYHGVDTHLFRPLPFEKLPHVVSVGSLTPLKGFDFLIRAIAEIPAGHRPPLVIASNFENLPERIYLEQLSRELGVELNLLSGINDDSLVQLYNQAILTAYAPVREPFGLVPLESMACGTPVVGVDEGGVRETVLHEKTGLLVDRNPANFAKAVSFLLNNVNLRTECGRNARSYAETRWTWEQATEMLGSYLSAGAQERPVAILQ